MSEQSGIKLMRERLVGHKVVSVDQDGSCGGGDCVFVIVVENGSTLVVQYSFEEGATCLDGHAINIEAAN